MELKRPHEIASRVADYMDSVGYESDDSFRIYEDIRRSSKDCKSWIKACVKAIPTIFEKGVGIEEESVRVMILRRVGVCAFVLALLIVYVLNPEH